MLLEVVVGALGDALELVEAPRELELDVGRAGRVVRQLVGVVRAQAQHVARDAEAHVPVEPLVAPVLVPLRRPRPAARRTRISICSNSRVRKIQFCGVISLRNDLPTWAMPNGGFLRVVCSTLAKLTNIPCAVSGRRYATAPASSTGPAWVLNIRLNWRASVNVPCAAVRARVRVVELVEAEALLAVRAVDERVGEVGEVAARLPDLRRAEDRGVDQHDVVALLHHRPDPGVLDVAQHQRAERAVVVGGAEPAVDLRRRVHEPAPLAEVDDLVQVGRRHSRPGYGPPPNRRAGSAGSSVRSAPDARRARRRASTWLRANPNWLRRSNMATARGGARCGARAPGGEDADLVGRRRLRARQGVVEPAAEDRRAAASSAGGRDRRARAARAAQHAALVEVERHQRDVRLGLAAADAGVELGTQPLGGQQLPVERRHDERRRPLGDRAQHADHHPVELRVRLALERQLVGRLQHGHPLRRPVEVDSIGASGSTDSAWLTMSSSRPRYSSRRTWLIGSSRAPNFDFVLRTPLATARTLPLSSVSRTTMRSASPSL